MKKLFAILISLFLVSGVYAKQYIYSIKCNKISTLTGAALVPTTAQKLQDDLEKVLFDLILKGFEIVEVIPSMADGFTVGYTIIYKDNK